MISAASQLSVGPEPTSSDGLMIESVEQGFVRGWLTSKYTAARLIVNERIVALIDESRLSPSDPSDDSGRRRFALDLRSIAPDLLVADQLTFELRPVSSTKANVARFEIPTMAFMKPVKAKFRKSTVEGYIDEYASGRLRGWLWDRAHPQRPVAVIVFFKNRFWGRYLADEHRPDIAALGKGDGYAGFNVDISSFYQKIGPGGRGLKVYSEDPEGWSVPLGEHLRIGWSQKLAKILRRNRELALRRRPNTTEEFVGQLVNTPPYPKKVFDIAAVAKRKMPDPFAADYTLMAIEFLRREAAMLSENMGKDEEGRGERSAQLQAIESQIAHLCKLGEAIATSQKLMHAASAAAEPRSGKNDEDRRRKA